MFLQQIFRTLYIMQQNINVVPRGPSGVGSLARVEAGFDRKAVQIGRASVVAAVFARRRRNRGLDFREAASRHRRNVQRTGQHSIQTSEAPGFRGRIGCQRGPVGWKRDCMFNSLD